MMNACPAEKDRFSIYQKAFFPPAQGSHAERSDCRIRHAAPIFNAGFAGVKIRMLRIPMPGILDLQDHVRAFAFTDTAVFREDPHPDLAAAVDFS